MLIKTLKNLGQAFVAGLLLTSLCAATSPLAVRIGVASYPPSLNTQLDKPTDLISRSITSMTKAGLDTIYLHYGDRWDLLYQDLVAGKLDASLWWAESKERRAQFHFPERPVITSDNSFTGLASNPRIQELEAQPSASALASLKIGQVKNFLIPKNVDKNRVIFVDDEKALLQGLLDGRFDLIILKTPYVLRKLKAQGHNTALKSVPFEPMNGFLIISKSISKHHVEAIIKANDNYTETIVVS